MRAIGFGLLGALLLVAPGCGGTAADTQGTVETEQTETQTPAQEPCAPAPEEQPTPGSGASGARGGVDAACRVDADCQPELGCREQPTLALCTQNSAACSCQVLLW